MSSSGTTSGDVLVIGGGLAGLSTALELSRRGAKVMVLNRDASESASMAAGGMLAPQAERLPAGGWVERGRDVWRGPQREGAARVLAKV